MLRAPSYASVERGGERVRCAMHVRVLALVVRGDAIDDGVGFCVVAPLSSHTRGFPLMRSRRIGKSRFTACGSKIPGGVASAGTSSGEISYANPDGAALAVG